MAKQFRLNRVGENRWFFRFRYIGDNVVPLTDEEVAQLRAEIDRAWEEGRQKELEEAKGG